MAVDKVRLQVERRAAPGGAVLVVAGEIDADTAGVLSDALAAAAAAAPSVVAVDFAAVTFMDSTGINTLLRAHHDMVARGTRLALAGALPAVVRVLDITGVDHVIPLYPSVDQALRS